MKIGIVLALARYYHQLDAAQAPAPCFGSSRRS